MACSAAIGFVISLIGAIGFAISGSYLNINAPLSLGFVNIPTFLIFVPITMFMAKIGAKTVHKFDKRLIGKLFGIYLFIISSKLFYDYFSFKFFDHIYQLFLFFSILSINSKIFSFISFIDVVLSVTITNEGLFEEALINPKNHLLK